MQPKLLATMITTTTYGPWFPGDPKRLEQSAQRMAYIARHAGCRMSDGMIMPRRCGDVETTDRMDSLH